MLAAIIADAQTSVGIGTTTPDSAAALDITATTKGLLIPRMDSAARAGIVNPPDGLMVFQKNGRKGFWYAAGGTWLFIPDEANTGDDLGNHTATKNLNLQNNLLVGSDFLGSAAGTQGINIKGSGLVGLSNTSPAQLLHLGTITYPKPNFVRFEAGKGGPARQWEAGVAVNASNPGDITGEYFDFAIRDVTASSTRMLIPYNNGYVGIGTSAPTQRLDVAGTVKGTALESTGGVNFGTSQLADGTLNTTMRMGGPTAGEGIAWKSTAGGNQYGLDLFTNGSSRLKVRNDGRIGINTTTPFALFSNTAGNTIGSETNGGNYYSLDWAGSQAGFIGQFFNAATIAPANGMAIKVASSTSTALDISRGTDQGTAGTPLLTVRSTGKVGIGTNSPAEALDVNGSVNVNGNITYSGNLGSILNYYTDTIGVSAFNYERILYTCVAPLKLVGGGGGAINVDTTHTDFRLMNSAPDISNTNSWVITCYNGDSHPVTIRTWIICASVQ